MTMLLFALSVVTAGLGIYYRDSCTVPYGCLGRAGLMLYVRCDRPLCPVNHTAVDLRQCRDDIGPDSATDTWLDEGCALLGGGCTRRFVKSEGEKPWCVPVALDRSGAYAPTVRVGTTKCLVDCDQDYGILDAAGNMSCACLPSPFQSYNACDLDYSTLKPKETPGCFCLSPTPCNPADCSCITTQGVLARALDFHTGRTDLRALYPFHDLFRVMPCRVQGNDTSTQCPVNWRLHALDEKSSLAIAQGYRFLRPSAHIFYQPTGLPVSALRANVCVCIQHCSGAFPKILCLMPVWSDRPVRCEPEFNLSSTRDLRHAVFPVDWQDPGIEKIKAVNGTVWTCSIASLDKCEMKTRIPLDSAPEWACLSPCRIQTCACASAGYRLFRLYNPNTTSVSFCSNSRTRSAPLWSVSVIRKGSRPCPNDARVKHLDPRERKGFALGYRLFSGGKWLQALPVLRPLRQGECLCIDGCEYGAPQLRCRLAPDPNLTLSRCHTPIQFSRGIGLGVVSIKDVPRVQCEGGKSDLVPCSDYFSVPSDP